MKEHEVIKYLIENKERGVAFYFMPEEVKEWCLDYSNWRSLYRFKEVGVWGKGYIWKSCNEDPCSEPVSRREIVCLMDKEDVKKYTPASTIAREDFKNLEDKALKIIKNNGFSNPSTLNFRFILNAGEQPKLGINIAFGDSEPDSLTIGLDFRSFESNFEKAFAEYARFLITEKLKKNEKN